MSESKPNSGTVWLDPADDAPEWTDEMFDIAAFSIGGKVIRPATGYLGPNGVVRGRPPSRGEAKRQLRHLTWGLVPSWSKDTKGGVRMINARAETLLEKPSFAKAARERRSLVPASGWYEWQLSPTALDAKGKPRKQPFYMRRVDGTDVAFAGLYEFWCDRSLPDGDPAAWLTTFAIITTSAGQGLDRIHDRQPLALEREPWAEWLDPTNQDIASLVDLFAERNDGILTMHPVSTEVNNVRNNDSALIDPV